MTALALDPEGRAKRAVLYGRQSKGKLHSIEEQLELGEEHADDEGWEIVAILQDAVSASRGMAKARGDWAKVIMMVRARQLDVIWLWESSRGDRDSTEWNKFLDACGDAGVAIWIDDEARLYDLQNPNDRHDMIVAGAANERESAKIRRRTLRAKRKARRAGALRTVVGGPPPVGFRNGKADWEAEPVVTACLNDIAARIIRGQSLSQAYRAQPPMWTQAHGEKCPAKLISEKMIRAALISPATAGLITVSAEDRTPLRQAIPRPPLDRETWDDVQGVFGPRRKSGHPTTDAYVFGPLLRCGKCGNQLSGEPLYYRRHGEVVKVTPSYRCKNPHKGIQEHPCRGVSISAPEVNEIIRAAYERWAAVSGNYAAAEAEQAGLSQQRIELEADIARWQERMAGVERRLLDDDITAPQYDDLTAGYTRKIAAGRVALAALAQEVRRPLPVVRDWPVMDPDLQRDLVRTAFKTPIAIAPGKGGPNPMPAASRFRLEPRRKAR
jgi:DNA invertase Pin-like site-specific DNA recombinase